MSKNLVLDSWINEMSELIAKETNGLIKTLGRPKDASVRLSVSVLQESVRLVILDVLTQHSERNDITREEVYVITKENFSGLKIQVQNSIARGFEQAFGEFTGRSVEYYCVINPVPEAINKEAC